MRRTRLLPVAALALLACEPAQPAAPPPPPTAAPPPPPAPPPAFAGASGTFRSERFGLRLPLPDGRAWRIDDHAGPWLTASHPATSSSLLVRSWTEDGRANRARCEERARLWYKLPERAGAEILQDRAVDAPAGFDTRLLVGIVSGAPNTPIGAFALAFGAHAHRCFVWAYTTSASGPGAERALGERLATMVEASLTKVTQENELVPTIRREPLGPKRD
ncbi:Hypothetical protein A7982_07823 [Minicystis rosea]|nr:Hypothetical protein A7982_07823 [Minicystis rosea]